MSYIVQLGDFYYGPFTSPIAAQQWAFGQRQDNHLGGYSILELRSPAPIRNGQQFIPEPWPFDIPQSEWDEYRIAYVRAHQQAPKQE